MGANKDGVYNNSSEVYVRYVNERTCTHEPLSRLIYWQHRYQSLGRKISSEGKGGEMM